MHFTISPVRYESAYLPLLLTLGSRKLINVFAEFMEGNGVLFTFLVLSLWVRLRIYIFSNIDYLYWGFFVNCVVKSLHFYIAFDNIFLFQKHFVCYENLPLSILYVSNNFSYFVIFLLTLLIVSFTPEKFCSNKIILFDLFTFYI